MWNGQNLCENRVKKYIYLSQWKGETKGSKEKGEKKSWMKETAERKIYDKKIRRKVIGVTVAEKWSTGEEKEDGVVEN